jgi:hypothetical protein
MCCLVNINCPILKIFKKKRCGSTILLLVIFNYDFFNLSKIMPFVKYIPAYSKKNFKIFLTTATFIEALQYFVLLLLFGLIIASNSSG